MRLEEEAIKNSLEIFAEDWKACTTPAGRFGVNMRAIMLVKYLTPTEDWVMYGAYYQARKRKQGTLSTH